MICFTLLTGMAKPMPSASELLALAFTMPMSEPLLLNRPPPELPGLTAASCWMSVINRPFDGDLAAERADHAAGGTCRAARRAGCRWRPRPSPTVSMSESPSVAGVRPLALILITARSLRASEPMSVASCVVSSLRMTVIFDAPSTT